MKKILLKIFDSEYVLPKIFVGLFLAIALWSFMRPAGNPELETETEASPVGLKRVRSVRMKSKLKKEEYLARMLEKERDLSAKYAHKSKQYTTDDQGSHHARQAWERDKERTRRFYSRFKHENTKNPNSVKVQLQNSLKSFEEDRPQ